MLFAFFCVCFVRNEWKSIINFNALFRCPVFTCLSLPSTDGFHYADDAALAKDWGPFKWHLRNRNLFLIPPFLDHSHEIRNSFSSNSNVFFRCWWLSICENRSGVENCLPVWGEFVSISNSIFPLALWRLNWKRKQTTHMEIEVVRLRNRWLPVSNSRHVFAWQPGLMVV